jgi:hypothetical protein
MLSPGRRSGAGRAVGEQGWSDISNEYNIGLVVQLITRGIHHVDVRLTGKSLTSAGQAAAADAVCAPA